MSTDESTHPALASWLAELAELDAQIGRCEAFKTQTFVFGTAGVVALAGSAISLHGMESAAEPLVVLLVTALCAVLGMFLVDRDESILGLLHYREHVIKPAVRELADDPRLLGSREFYNREIYGRNRPMLRKIAHRLTAPFPHALFYVAGVAAWVYLVLMYAEDRIGGVGWLLACAGSGFALLWSYLAAFLTGAQWANLAAPPDEKGIPFARRRNKCALPSPAGWLPGDPHVHTNWSDGHASIWSQAAAAAGRGLRWVGFTDHTDGIGEDWHGFVSAVREVEGRIGRLTLLPGAEVTLVESPGGKATGDMLVYGWPTGGDVPPGNRAYSPSEALAISGRAGAVVALAHPFGGGAPFGGAIRWREWGVSGFGAMELLSNERVASLEARRKWFEMLKVGLHGAVAGEGFVVATGGTDSHRPFDKPGTKGMTWVHSDSSSGKAIVDALAAGHSVVSGVGDFGTITIGSAWPGEVVPRKLRGHVSVGIVQRPSARRYCTRIEVFGLDPEVPLVSLDGPFRPEFETDVPIPPGAGMFVARFEFRAARGISKSAEVWTNPIFYSASRSRD
ncbi:MAG: hypothetical protein CVT66_06820 [Actinobacteria bacterium HGW-Actinobacteria-6]|nr:MAG: hypothetical protein CVT66_06820 [Actinobacteria bacterium HGW-Actinobacteria-6]